MMSKSSYDIIYRSVRGKYKYLWGKLGIDARPFKNMTWFLVIQSLMQMGVPFKALWFAIFIMLHIPHMWYIVCLVCFVLLLIQYSKMLKTLLNSSAHITELGKVISIIILRGNTHPSISYIYFWWICTELVVGVCFDLYIHLVAQIFDMFLLECSVSFILFF